MDVEPALPRGAFDRRVEIEFVRRTLAREAAQPAQRDLDIAGAQLLGVVEIPELALVPHLQRAFVLALAADPHALRVIAGIAIGTCAAGADPLVAALVAPLLFVEPLLQRLHDLFP